MDANLAIDLGRAVVNDGGTVPLSLLPVRQPWLRKRLGDKRLLEFLKTHSDVFILSDDQDSFKVSVHPDFSSTLSNPIDDCKRTNKAADTLCQWVVLTLLNEKTGKRAMQLSWITSNQRVTTKLHDYTKESGCCKGNEAFSTAWWDNASETLLSLLKQDTRFVVSDSEELRDTMVTLDASVVPDDDLWKGKLEGRVGYLLRQNARIIRKGAPPPQPEMPISKLGADEELQLFCRGRPLQSALREIPSVILEQRKGMPWVLLIKDAGGESDDIQVVAKKVAVEVPALSSMILHAAENYFAVSKPSGVTTEAIVHLLREEGKLNDRSVDSVSRLDRPTSGVVLLPLTKHGETHLGGQFRGGTVKKTYLALVSGKVEGDGTVDARLKLVDSGSTYKSFVHPSGKPATTTYKVKEVFTKNGGIYTLLEVSPLTGRTHQIRAHMSHIKHPLVCDARYSGEKRAGRHSKWCPRLFLHSYKVRFVCPDAHPEEGGEGGKEEEEERKELLAPLPEDLENVLSVLRGVTV